jgi:hypothetical protein
VYNITAYLSIGERVLERQMDKNDKRDPLLDLYRTENLGICKGDAQKHLKNMAEVEGVPHNDRTWDT